VRRVCPTSVSVLLLASLVSGCYYGLGIYPVQPLWYRADPIEAWVVDEATGEPLGGVIVVAHWQLVNSPGGGPVGQMAVMETVTDEAGRFAFPGWGPKLRPPWGVLIDDDPEVMLFKSGYVYDLLSNRGRRPEESRRVRRKAAWNGTKVEMRPCSGAETQCEERLRYLTMFTYGFPFNKQCDWRRMRRLLRAFATEREKLGVRPEQASGPPPLEEMQRRNAPFDRWCGDVAEALERCRD